MFRSKLLLLLIFLSFTNEVKFNLLCDDAIKFFPGYKCIDDSFGTGASALVYKIKKDDKEYLLKIQQNKGKRIEDNKEVFYLKKLKNVKGVIKLIDYEFDGSYIYEVLQLGEKGNLKHFLQKSEYFKNNMNLVIFLLSFCKTLKEVHEKGIVHADIKPLNIVIDSDFNPLLIDFDIAVNMDSKEQVRGTPYYMDPNLVINWDHFRLFNDKNDVYSLGSTLFYILFGKTPFYGKTLLHLKENVEKGEIIIPEGTPLVFAKILEGALQKNEEDRFDMKTIIGLLEEAINANDVDIKVETTLKLVNRNIRLTKKKQKKISWEMALLLFCISSVILILIVMLLFYLNKKNVERHTVEIPSLNTMDIIIRN
jgi:serine/threonine protein kinase